MKRIVKYSCAKCQNEWRAELDFEPICSSCGSEEVYLDVFMSGNEITAFAAALSRAQYSSMYPITPQTLIIETLAELEADGHTDMVLEQMESEHSVLAAAEGAGLMGIRVYFATSSQGVLYAYENFPKMAGNRVPAVGIIVSRTVATPIGLLPDHFDFLCLRDTGCVLLFSWDCQSVADFTIMAFKIAEDPRVRLPVIIGMDGFEVSFTEEPARLPNRKLADKFMGEREIHKSAITQNDPKAYGVAILDPLVTQKFRAQHHIACVNALEVIKEVQKEFGEIFGRKYNIPAEGFMLDDAELALVVMGSIGTTARDAIKELREEGIKVGLLQLALLRPLPEKELVEVLKNKKAVGIVDRDYSLGKRGAVLFTELEGPLRRIPNGPKVISNFIAGIGGVPQTTESFKKIVHKLMEHLEKGESAVEWSDLEESDYQ